ncbi:hypothetical protein DKP78_13995 [Enterococcus faecium]|nr:hypothetical protein DKP78_13995 [Enterococcus faecium]
MLPSHSQDTAAVNAIKHTGQALLFKKIKMFLINSLGGNEKKDRHCKTTYLFRPKTIIPEAHKQRKTHLKKSIYTPTKKGTPNPT